MQKDANKDKWYTAQSAKVRVSRLEIDDKFIERQTDKCLLGNLFTFGNIAYSELKARVTWCLIDQSGLKKYEY